MVVVDSEYELQAQIRYSRRQDVFQIVKNMRVLTEGADAVSTHVFELAMGHGDDDAVVGVLLWLPDEPNAVFMTGVFC